jgi:hypothetical protein
MRTTYGVIWQNGRMLSHAGKLELDAAGIRLEGAGAEGQAFVEELAYREVAGVRIARSRSDRLEGRPTLVLDRVDGEALRVASVSQSGVVAELAERLCTLTAALPQP